MLRAETLAARFGGGTKWSTRQGSGCMQSPHKAHKTMAIASGNPCESFNSASSANVISLPRLGPVLFMRSALRRLDNDSQICLCNTWILFGQVQNLPHHWQPNLHFG